MGHHRVSRVYLRLAALTLFGPLPIAFLQPTTRSTEAPSDELDPSRQQSALGTSDAFCHVIVGGPPFCYTLCGQRLDPWQRDGHPLGPCPNGIPFCPECDQILLDETDRNRR
jgi:hypothetical protein